MTPYYEDDWCTIYHGDCRDVLPSLGPVPFVFTSPPYNLGTTTGGGFGHYTDSAGMRQRGGGGKWTGGVLAHGYGAHDDAMPMPEYEAWQRSVLATLWAQLTNDGAIFYNHKPRPMGTLWHPRVLANHNFACATRIAAGPVEPHDEPPRMTRECGPGAWPVELGEEPRG